MKRFELRDRTVVITGASGGIGGEAALAFARRGARLVLSGRDRAALEQVADRVQALGAVAHIVPADVTRQEEMEALVREAIALTGGIEVMMLGAGYGLLGEVAHVTLAEWRRQMDVNFFGALYGFYAALPHFRERGHGRYVIMNSLSGRLAMGLSAPYCASKFALWGFADSARPELAEMNIGLTSVYPYFVTTGFQGNIQSPDFHVDPDLARRMWGQSPVKLAEQIARAVERNRGEVLCTALGKIGVRAAPLSYHLSEAVRRLILPYTRRILGAKAEK